MKPVAFVDPTGFVVPITSKEAVKNFQGGRFLYSQAEVEVAMKQWEAITDERRRIADENREDEQVLEINPNTGAYEVVEVAEPSEAVKPQQVTAPPPSLHVPPTNVNLTEEQLKENRGINSAEAVSAVFGE